MKLLLSVLILFQACSSSSPTAVSEGKGMNLPPWINEPMKNCSLQMELCAVGEGTGAMTAEANARKAIAQIFETQIKAETNTDMRIQQTNKDEALSGEAIHSMDSHVQELTEDVLKGVVIKERYESEGMNYAHASLDKRTSLKRLQSEMELLDESMLAMYREKNRSHSRKLIEQYNLREKINLRYE